MRTITVKASKQYDILLGKGLLARAGELTKQVVPPCRAALVTDDQVDGLYARIVEASYENAGYDLCKFVFPHGEGSKSLTVLGELLEFLAANNLTKTDLIIALGGGVTGDMAGFAAAVYLREIRFVQLPTTFLAAVDSSVGGKTAVNLRAGKNLAGAFCQPVRVICDTECFATLPPEVFADGSAEAIKYGCICDKALLERTAAGINPLDCDEIVERCVSIKRDIVAEDEFDNGSRQLLNFGHTIGHGIEKLSEFEITHGHAVAMGMALVAKAAFRSGYSSEDCTPALLAALERNGLPASCPYPAHELAQAAMSDKKRRGGSLTLVLPHALGDCRLHPTPVEEVEAFIALGLDEVEQ